MNSIDRANAIAEIQHIFGVYRAVQPTDPAVLSALTDGKLFELIVLSDLLSDLRSRASTLKFIGSAPPLRAQPGSHLTLKFKASPGKIKTSDSHFEMRSHGSTQVDYRIFVDVEFDTLAIICNRRATIAEGTSSTSL